MKSLFFKPATKHYHNNNKATKDAYIKRKNSHWRGKTNGIRDNKKTGLLVESGGTQTLLMNWSQK